MAFARSGGSRKRAVVVVVVVAAAAGRSCARVEVLFCSEVDFLCALTIHVNV
jgi:hypothetical protein